MKRIALSMLLLICMVSVSHAAQKKMSLQIRKGELRSSPSFLSSVVTSVKYGDRFTVLENSGGWIKVSFQKTGKSGWIHESALTKKKIKIASGPRDAELAASSGELALAGKGFNSDVEAEFKANNSDADFTWIDKMEKIKVSIKQSRKFLAQGKIRPAKGGQK